MFQNLTWLKDLLKVQDKPIYFNVTQFSDRLLDFKLKFILGNRYLLRFGIYIYMKLSEKVVEV